MEKEYLNEEKYQESVKKLKSIGKGILIGGIITLVLGLILIVVGFAGVGNSAIDNFNSFDSSSMNSAFGNIGVFAFGGLLNTIGFLATIVGGMIMLIAHRREITAFTVQQTMPLAKEGIDKMAPTVGKAAGTIAKEIKKGLNEADNE